MLSVLTWLTLSMVSESALVLPPPAEFGIAPAMPTLVEGLPESRLMREEICFPWVRYEAMEEWTRYAKAYPSRVCQLAIDTTVVGCRMWADNQLAQETDHHNQIVAKMRIEASKGWQWWEVTGFVTGAFLLGSLAGYLGNQYL